MIGPQPALAEDLPTISAPLSQLATKDHQNQFPGKRFVGGNGSPIRDRLVLRDAFRTVGNLLPSSVWFSTANCDLQSMVSRVNEVAKSVGLSINAGKTKVFSSCIPDQEKAPLGIDDCQLEEVDSFKYLGARLLPNGQSKDDIVSQIDAARWVFSSLRKCLWNRRDLSIATKIRVYRASVRSVLLYGCECWALRVEDERKLEVFDHHCLRTILRVKFTDFVSNETVRARCDNIARITQAIQERRLRWFGHVLRRPPQELSVTALDPAPLLHWRRRRGGQFKTWLDTVRQDMEVVLGPSVFGLRRWRREWVELSRSAAADRHAWRGTVRDIIEAG
ncbi:hypothetical protein SprV_0802555500 [Sparganum proliferum]